MYIAAFIFECAYCNGSFSTLNTGLVGSEEINYVPVKISFKSGLIEFACPECKQLNKMEWINTDNLNKYTQLPKVRRT